MEITLTAVLPAVSIFGLVGVFLYIRAEFKSLHKSLDRLFDKEQKHVEVHQELDRAVGKLEGKVA